jgi:hypothetical protein
MDNIKNYLKLSNRNVELLSKEYVYINSKLLFKCLIDGYEWEASWRSFYNQNNGCPKGGGTLKLELKDIKEEMKQINNNIEILSDEYINYETDLHCFCHLHNNDFYSKWRELKAGHNGCLKCKSELFSKVTIFRTLKLKKENSPSWKGGITPLHNYLRDKINKWKQDSFKKYNYRCDITGVNKNLIIHHFYNFSDILKETMGSLELPIYEQINKYTDTDIELKLIENKCLELHYKYGLGVCLCKEIHDEFHKIYGKYNNSIEQYEEF